MGNCPLYLTLKSATGFKFRAKLFTLSKYLTDTHIT